MKRVSVWGSTGSIGQQTLDVIGRHKRQFHVEVLTAHENVPLLLEQAKRFRPQCVVITGDAEKSAWAKQFAALGIEVLWGKEGLLEAAGRKKKHLAVNALVGSVGLEATIEALKAGNSIALANKEVLVMAGELVREEARKRGVSLIPVDSEHSAIFQCLQGEDIRNVRRLLLTASGGPFLNTDESELDQVTVEDALTHPNWTMGRKVSVDSATMMNKGLEIIEARWLFGIEPEKIEVVVHPQSIIHSMVEFVDGSVKAQLGVPDMRIPIAYALAYPDRWPGNYGYMDFAKTSELQFLPPDMKKFSALQQACKALEMGGTAPAVLNAADEVAVDLFLSGKIQYTQIIQIVEEALRRHCVVTNPKIHDILEADRWTRTVVMDTILRTWKDRT